MQSGAAAPRRASFSSHRLFPVTPYSQKEIPFFDINASSLIVRSLPRSSRPFHQSSPSQVAQSRWNWNWLHPTPLAPLPIAPLAHSRKVAHMAHPHPVTDTRSHSSPGVFNSFSFARTRNFPCIRDLLDLNPEVVPRFSGLTSPAAK